MAARRIQGTTNTQEGSLTELSALSVKAEQPQDATCCVTLGVGHYRGSAAAVVRIASADVY
jgi:hypothetical protein